jgi:hypothetical protein
MAADTTPTDRCQHCAERLPVHRESCPLSPCPKCVATAPPLGQVAGSYQCAQNDTCPRRAGET